MWKIDYIVYNLYFEKYQFEIFKALCAYVPMKLKVLVFEQPQHKVCKGQEEIKAWSG